MSYLKTINIQHLTSGTNNIVLDANGNMTCAGTISAATPTGGMRNKIINGDMRIDQRNAGAEVNPAVNGIYYLDRWLASSTTASKFKIQQDAGSVTPPVGFTDYLGITSISTYAISASDVFWVSQRIEGYNIADLAWGTASAKPVTLSFWVYSSLTGTFGGALRNSDNGRSYPFSYTINTANTWEYKTITIPGDTTGTWLTTSGIGIRLIFAFGVGSVASGPAGSWAAANYASVSGATSVVGTNGATFYITGVQLETGSVATAFERRLYTTELQLCQRYYQKSYDLNLVPGATSGNYYGGSVMVVAHAASTVRLYAAFRVSMRATPTVTLYNPYSGTSGQLSENSSTTNIAASTPIPSTEGFYAGSSSSVVSGRSYEFHYTASIEL